MAKTKKNNKSHSLNDKNKAKNSIEEMKAMFSQTEVKKASSNYIRMDVRSPAGSGDRPAIYRHRALDQ